MNNIPNEVVNVDEFLNSKYHDLIAVKCSVCGNIQQKVKRLIMNRAWRNKSVNYTCSSNCNIIRIASSAVYNCKFCDSQITRKKSTVLESQNVFCNKSCAAKYNNIHRKSGCVRSQAEIYLANLIRNDYPSIKIKENCKSFLTCKYEIDILLEDIKFAIELNGPTHFIPIYGMNVLNNIKHRDFVKSQELQSLGFNLLIIDISNQGYFKKTKVFLENIYLSKIRPVIDESLMLQQAKTQ